MVTEKSLAIGGGLLLGAALAYIVAKGVNASAAAVGAAAAGAIGGAAAGTVIGAGSLIGIPETDTTKCAAAQRDGRTFDASLYCPAADFFRYITGNTGGASGSW